ncbi:hypothetical protein [Streptomyces sp. NPDC048340]|uniref:type IV toxin-antitoxin system AbiEi family antitoxin domain-containing protein n=1 Tax=Streptomyces sp. NPDC048340 TaxID=3365537 RepID=UPI00371B9ADA
MLKDRTDTRAKLWRTASAQRGYFTAAQAKEAGYTYQAQRYHAQHGNWLLVDRAIYRFREFSDLPETGDEHLVRWSLWSKSRAVISHSTALATHDLGTPNPSQIHLTVPTVFRQRSDALVLHHAELAEEHVEQRMGYRVTTPLRALVETAADGVGQDSLDVAVATAIRRGLVTQKELRHAAQQLGPRAELGMERALVAAS